MDKIFIVLAAHQRLAYLRPQIQSIRRQSLADWTLLVRDDGSTDSTPEILQEMAARDNRIRVLPGDGRRDGAAGNFALLIERAFDLAPTTFSWPIRTMSGRPTSFAGKWSRCVEAKWPPARGSTTLSIPIWWWSMSGCRPSTTPFSGALGSTKAGGSRSGPCWGKLRAGLHLRP